jgi:hypothetical protein
LPAQPLGHLRRTVERRKRVLLVDEPHELQVEFGLADGLVVVARPAQANQLALARDRRVRMMRIDPLTADLGRRCQLFFSGTPALSVRDVRPGIQERQGL